ncbi:MAG TPA: winged helix-turn-helix domain-containing protein [Cyclobacteriaceae bacterium]|nr:winged helix-turn-helix domain-containing protein [Cyclobacteriaceae bacterium]
MGVNSVNKGFFTNRLVVGSGIAIVMLAVFFIASSFTKPSDHDLRAKQANLIIRQIGHRLLLQAGDSTSRVLPVTESKEGTFLLTFENEFVFNHDSLMMLTQSSFPKTQFPSGYTVTVHECTNAGIVYGFQINHTAPDILACRGRSQPPGCYTIEIAFPDLYESVEQKKADIDQLTEELKSSKVDPQEANPKREELKSFKVDSQEANPKLEEVETTTLAYPFISLVSSGMLVLLSDALLIGRFGKSLVPVPVRNQDHAILKESAPEVSALGKFLFDAKDQRLLLGSEVISLTGKEYLILELLNKNFGELIPRETLMQKVWINEGVITGRSLDMFVSKLRKKLSSDPELRITNVHGKGYKLEIPGIQIL